MRSFRQLIDHISKTTSILQSCSNNGSIRRCLSTTTSYQMRLVQFRTENGPQRLGAQLTGDGDIIDISGVAPCIPNNLIEFIEGGDELMQKAKRVVAEGASIIPVDNAQFCAPLTKPDKVICVGLNYKSHCDEQKHPYPEEPVFFSKFPSTIVGPTDDVIHPPNTSALDYEIELAVVIGKTCRLVRAKDVRDYIFGYTVAQDISARDWQTKKKNAGQWLFAKSMDTFCPLGPGVVTKEFISDPHVLRLKCTVNGDVRQDCSTSDMVHGIDEIIAYLSHCITLLPGDVVLTGTPAGVGLFRNPREFLKVGDVIESEISSIGKITNVISEK